MTMLVPYPSDGNTAAEGELVIGGIQGTEIPNNTVKEAREGKTKFTDPTKEKSAA